MKTIKRALAILAAVGLLTAAGSTAFAQAKRVERERGRPGIGQLSPERLERLCRLALANRGFSVLKN